ncbi:MAG: hypothetical protein V4671_22100 [Armatimonadota bacterium]
MKSVRIFQTLLLTALLSTLAGSATAAFAEQLLFQRGATLYAAEMDGTEARPLFDLGPVSGASASADGDAIWSAAPDGRRVAWMNRGAAIVGADPTAVNLRDRPAQIFLSDLTGRHQKPLFSTATLHDRQNKKVTSVGINLLGAPEEIPVRKFESWEPVSLAWSADSRTLYVSCSCLLPTLALKATFAVDAATGIALVDADGRWKSVAPMTDVHASGVLIVGSGAAQNQAGTVDAPAARYSPLYLTNLAAGTRSPLFDAATQNTTPLPDYALTRTPALSGNDNRYIAFASVNRGLWILDRTTQQYRPLLERSVLRPRWAAEATGLYFLEARPVQAGKTTYDLYAADFVPSTGQLGLPRPLLQSVDWFDVVPD